MMPLECLPMSLQYVDCVGIDMRVDTDTQTFSCMALPTHKLLCMERNTTSVKFDVRRAAESTRFGVAALSLSGTVLGRRVSLGYVYGVEHK